MKFLLPYIQLARLDKPIGSWLLLLPCWWGLVVGLDGGGAGGGGTAALGEVLRLGFLFASGAILMRGAGCTYNDLADHRFDAHVERTKTRPLPSGAVSRKQAKGFLLLLLGMAALVLLQFNTPTIFCGLLSLVLVAIYPFMKRITYMPQFFLGLAFSWGVLMGATAIAGDKAAALVVELLILYAASVLWVIAYDTIYALQDKQDDLSLGLKSSALLFGDRVKLALAGLFAASWSGLVLFGIVAHASIGFYSGLVLVGAHFTWQVYTLNIDDQDSALRRFQSNRECGLLILACLVATPISVALSAPSAVFGDKFYSFNSLNGLY